MKVMSFNELQRLADRASILVNVDTKAPFERVTSQFTSQLVRKVEPFRRLSAGERIRAV
jgi:hypothetical protein